ncbi:MAG: Transaldolase [Candidatus Saccharibacteria bacterium]|nr:Transaldolase [Candidatus Saccharibacteria bacterium]
MNALQNLTHAYQQSPWLDNLSRDLITSGNLDHYVKQGIRGLTSNPTIFENAITHGNLYDDQIAQLSKDGLNEEEIYWRIAIQDIRAAAKILEPVYDASNGQDGFVSLEVSPRLAHDTAGTIAQARTLWQQLGLKNLMIKVPATDAGIPAIQTLLSEGINVNVTLIFSLDHYKQVVKSHTSTHIQGNKAVSVASFFISRVDNEIDNQLNQIGTPEALALRGKAAIAQAHLAYEIFLKNFTSTDEDTNVQRLLWASTSTKNPDYDDLLYVRSLVASHTINTLPEDTIAKIIDHLERDIKPISKETIANAQRTFKAINDVGVDLDDVARTLEREGVEKFQKSFDSLLAAIKKQF